MDPEDCRVSSNTVTVFGQVLGVPFFIMALDRAEGGGLITQQRLSTESTTSTTQDVAAAAKKIGGTRLFQCNSHAS